MAKILIVDDSRTSRKILKGILECDGHEIIGEAKNGDEGYKMYCELQPDITTMDVTMPVLDGIESLKRIRADYPEAVVVMVTAAGQKTKMVEAVQSGAIEFISKPFEVEKLKDVINRVAKN